MPQPLSGLIVTKVPSRGPPTIVPQRVPLVGDRGADPIREIAPHPECASRAVALDARESLEPQGDGVCCDAVGPGAAANSCAVGFSSGRRPSCRERSDGDRAHSFETPSPHCASLASGLIRVGLPPGFLQSWGIPDLPSVAEVCFCRSQRDPPAPEIRRQRC